MKTNTSGRCGSATSSALPFRWFPACTYASEEPPISPAHPRIPAALLAVLTAAVAMKTRSIFGLFFIFFFCKLVAAIDVFCGQLEIFNEKRFGQGAITVSSQTTSDMKQCLDVCCSIPNCDGVTFEGITSTEFDDANCLLVSCEPECQFNVPSSSKSSGVLSVLIHRIRNETSTSEPSTTASSFVPEIRAALTPFWVLAVAIGVAAICVGLNVTLCVAYCCYCRRKKRSQKAHISTVKGGPTLHAYNPQI